ncbi:hypothetical protein AK51_09605 [Serratia nematodiphila DZ0503SBS1]|nr:hypothetical protein AK51_09605 [Serratia nematodiphila DZ0503SBS1]
MPPYATVLQEASAAGYRSIELGRWGYLPTQSEALCARAGAASSVAGGRHDFDDLVSEANLSACWI